MARTIAITCQCGTVVTGPDDRAAWVIFGQHVEAAFESEEGQHSQTSVDDVEWNDDEPTTSMRGKDAELQILRSTVRWMAQTVHQAYHDDIGGLWVACPRSVCREALRRIGAQ